MVDGGSSDGTIARCRALGARVVRSAWPGFVVQKNHALDAARGHFVLSLDADEWLTRPALREVERVLARPGDAVGWSFARCSRWAGRPIRHGRWFPDRRLRLVRREAARWIGTEPVDLLKVDGRIEDLDAEIGHDPYRSLAEHLATIDRYSGAHARSLREQGVRSRPWTPLVRGTWHLADSLLLRQGWRDGWRGVALGGLGAAHTALKWRRVRCGSP